MENTPNAAAAPATEAAPNTNSNPTTEGSTLVNPAPSPDPASAPDPFDNFVNANGGRDKVLEKMKQAIGNPEEYARSILGLDNNNQPLNAQASVQPQQMQEAQQPQGQIQTPIQPPQVSDDYITPQKEFQISYRDRIAKDYPELGEEYMNKGEYLNEASAMGIPVVDSYGNINDKAVRQFLNLKKAAVAPAPTSTPITTTPTVDYVHAEGDITTQKMADDIMKQGKSHPRFAEAQKFTAERLGIKSPSSPKQK